MLSVETMLDTVTVISGVNDIHMDMLFSDLGMDSTNLVELLIEFEIMFDVDLLDEQLNLDEITTIQNAFDFIKHLIRERQR